MSIVLVTGASGYIGGRLVPELLGRGHRVRCLARTPSKLDDAPWRDQVEVVAGDVTRPDTLVACGALHVIWSDVAEVRTLAVDPAVAGRGHGGALLTGLLARAAELGVDKVFCLTFETRFFARHGFAEIQGTPVSPEVYEQLLLSFDEGVAEFLDLERVKPNTLGNSRMLYQF